MKKAAALPIALGLLFIAFIVCIIAPALGGSSSSDSTVDCSGGLAKVPKEYRDDVRKAGDTSGNGAALIAGQIQQESGWKTTIGSDAGAVGLAQFVQGTWDIYEPGKDRTDGHASIDAQGRYLADIKSRLKDKPYAKGKNLTDLALAAYNSGEGNVDKYSGVPPFKETQNYIPAVHHYADTLYSDAGQCTNGGGDDDSSGGKWVAPLKGSVITAPFGERRPDDPNGTHAGIDFAMADGSTADEVAATNMTIVNTPDGGIRINADGKPGDHFPPFPASYGAGNYVVARENAAPHRYLFYFHMSSVKVKAGDKVKKGTVVGHEGETGHAFGAHLHFQVEPPNADPSNIQNSIAIDPSPMLGTVKGK